MLREHVPGLLRRESSQFGDANGLAFELVARAQATKPESPRVPMCFRTASDSLAAGCDIMDSYQSRK